MSPRCFCYYRNGPAGNMDSNQWIPPKKSLGPVRNNLRQCRCEKTFIPTDLAGEAVFLLAPQLPLERVFVDRAEQLIHNATASPTATVDHRRHHLFWNQRRPRLGWEPTTAPPPAPAGLGATPLPPSGFAVAHALGQKWNANGRPRPDAPPPRPRPRRLAARSPAHHRPRDRRRRRARPSINSCCASRRNVPANDLPSNT